MGSLNPYQISTNRVQPGLNQHPGITLEKPVEITILINSAYYFIQCVFIILQPNQFRLVVLHNNHVLCDKTYPTLHGAKIAFGKLFQKKAWKEDVISQWSAPYPPDTDWLEDKFKALKDV